MEIRFLEEFVSLVETCSFQETAEQLMLSQSALTKHIHHLEEEIGMSLFDRSTRSVKLNEYSTAFYPRAKEILAIYQEGLQELNDLKTNSAERLHIAFTPGAAQYDTVELIARFQKQYPEIEVTLTETHHISDLLTKKACDFAFITEETSVGTSVTRFQFFNDHLAAIVAPNNPLAHRDSLSLEELAEKQFIIHAKVDGSYHLETKKFLSACKKKNIKPNIVARASFTSTIARMVAEEQGIAILNHYQFPSDITTVKAIPIEPLIESYVHLVSHPRLNRKLAHKQFIEYFYEEMSDRRKKHTI